jgi:PKD repeat protein
MAAVLAVMGCSLDKQGAPQLAGPSEMGLSLTVTVDRDIIAQDGVSQAVVSITAVDALQRPTRVQLRIETAVGNNLIDFGSLSARTVFTESDGRTSVKYTAPPAPPANSGASDVIVSVVVTPIGNNYANTISRRVDVRVSPEIVRVGPNGTPVAKFTFSPTSPKDHEDVFFDGSSSTDDGTIVSYQWSFGDGATASGVKATHEYGLPGKYIVVLTVTDDRGMSASSTPTEVTVGANTNPTASFTTSPSNPVAGVTTVFVNGSASTAAAGRVIVSWEWDFGDGTHTSGVTSSHVYGTAGTYTIVLLVRDTAGQVHSTSKTITVTP